jgi:hypothetical protein
VRQARRGKWRRGTGGKLELVWYRLTIEPAKEPTAELPTAELPVVTINCGCLEVTTTDGSK